MRAEVATSSFAGPPQAVEVFHAGRWFPGELLGWRHDEAGCCRVRVRCVVGGLRHTAWTDLAQLRLPAPVRPPVPDVARVAGPPPARDRHALGAPADLPRPRRAGLVEWLRST
ncbi:hypothetical protein GCU56_05425 [Geodermatophilus sabuli]|uniref:Uncharacterized protein n=1 Tax=Geodermatophilus sabuli TaxID=1564158 RepID=A0A7K3VYX3_9ACTN|nr:hypothetical protein [Geodermatophilus sabuli]NEK57313.1 hypothetical protein [Geodermatophilus sabuli]